MTRRFQFSLRALLVMTAIIAAFFAGESDGRRRENYRVTRVYELREDLAWFSRQYSNRRLMPPNVRREYEETEDELKKLLGIDW
ncbi:MAG TPA: hypothetical protein VJ783_21110 [Pirellulales bacterium]|nr:hypothetical protein [Pirellulales bacterium]